MLQADLELGLDVQRLLNSTIRPLLNVDAGDAEVTSVVDGHVTITLLGSCSRCLFRGSCATYTVLDRLERHLGDRDATFAVAGNAIPRESSRMQAAAPVSAAPVGAAPTDLEEQP